MRFARFLRLCLLTLLAVYSASAAQETDVRQASDVPVDSRFSFVAAAEAPGIAIPHFASFSSSALAAEGVRGVLVELPTSDRGPVEFYVNGAWVGTVQHPPFLLVRPELVQAGTWRVLAMPDVGYPAEVTYSIE